MSEKPLKPRAPTSEEPHEPAKNSYTFSFTLTRTGPGFTPGVRRTEYVKVLPARDIAFLAGALMLFLLEPMVLYWAFARAPVQERLAALLDAHPEATARAFEEVPRNAGGLQPEPAQDARAPGALVGEDADLITPLNVRDPSALVIGPGRP